MCQVYRLSKVFIRVGWTGMEQGADRDLYDIAVLQAELLSELVKQTHNVNKTLSELSVRLAAAETLLESPGVKMLTKARTAWKGITP